MANRLRVRASWRSVRAKATLGATVVAGVALIGGAVAFAGVLNTSLQDASARAAEARAAEVLDRTFGREGPGYVRSIDDEIVVVVDRDGKVLAASEDFYDDDVRLPVAPEPQQVTIDGERMLVVSEDDDRGHTAVVATSLEETIAAVQTVSVQLIVAVPLLAGLIGVITWVVVGRALAPVGRIRADVDQITADHLHRRVPVPATGDEIAALAVTMNEMLDRLDVAARAQRQFISDASHELRSPLATIRQHAELSQAHPEITSVAELASIVHGEGLRLQGLVDALLLLARLDEQAPTAHDDSVDLDDLALVEVSRLRQAGEVSVDGSGIGPARVHGDARLLGQLMRNLADNAARHARARVWVSVTERAGQAVVVVEDDGLGVPEAERSRIFERFVRLDEARARDTGGSGLGLAIVQGIAEASGGEVSVGRSPAGGARFTVTLPTAP